MQCNVSLQTESLTFASLLCAATIPFRVSQKISLKLQFWVDTRCHKISTKVHFVVINLGLRSAPLNWSVIPWGRGTVELGKGWCVHLYPLPSEKKKCLWAHEATKCNTWASSVERRVDSQTFYPQDNYVIGSQCCRFYCHIKVCKIKPVTTSSKQV